MPELPEVEIVRRGIAPRIAARTVRAVVVRTPALRWPVPAELAARLEGGVVRCVERRGKYLLIRFDAGWLIAHLGMSGNLRWVGHDVAPRCHDHVDLRFDDGVLRLHDPRRFGAVLWHPCEAGPIGAHPLIARLGLEPMETDVGTLGQRLHAGTRGRRVSIKSVLLAGELVVGVGNIYASESLFRARIHPARPAGRIGEARCLRLAQAIRDTLGEAIARGGSTLRDFASADGEAGHFQLDALVYDCEGQPCRACGTPIRRIVQQQRATYYCPACQR